MEDVIDFELENSLNVYLKYRNYCFANYIQYVPNHDFDKLINSRYAKVSRIKKRFLYLLSHREYVYFLTFTFDDQVIKKCDRTKKDLIKNAINTFSDDVLIILNKDYGDLHNREHYHALVGTNDSGNILEHIKSLYPCIFYVERARTKTKDIKKLCKYINKLTNHCIKDSTQKSRLYFNFKGFDDLDPIYYFICKSKYHL